ncbi:hypothetical protein VTO73DRAFT_3467 [Trametes versicolor]
MPVLPHHVRAESSPLALSCSACRVAPWLVPRPAGSVHASGRLFASKRAQEPTPRAIQKRKISGMVGRELEDTDLRRGASHGMNTTYARAYAIAGHRAPGACRASTLRTFCPTVRPLVSPRTCLNLCYILRAVSRSPEPGRSVGHDRVRRREADTTRRRASRTATPQRRERERRRARTRWYVLATPPSSAHAPYDDPARLLPPYRPRRPVDGVRELGFRSHLQGEIEGAVRAVQPLPPGSGNLATGHDSGGVVSWSVVHGDGGARHAGRSLVHWARSRCTWGVRRRRRTSQAHRARSMHVCARGAPWTASRCLEGRSPPARRETCTVRPRRARQNASRADVERAKDVPCQILPPEEAFRGGDAHFSVVEA